jgi:hypothetical protein
MLDQLSLPPNTNLESLNEAMVEAAAGEGEYSYRMNGNHEELNEALLWLEQQLDPQPVVVPSYPTRAMEPPLPAPILETEPDELLAAVATLDEAEIAELTADMPDDPDEALNWLMSLADELEEQEPAGSVEAEARIQPQQPQRTLVFETAEPPVVEAPTSDHSQLEIAIALPATEELPEMPDDPDEAIAWIERLAALESEGKGTTTLSPVPPLEVAEEVQLATDSSATAAHSVVDEPVGEPTMSDEHALVGSIFDAPITVEEASGEVVEFFDTLELSDELEFADEMELADESEAAEEATLLEPEPDEQPGRQQQPPVATRQPHERWLKQLQPPPWLVAKED